MTTRFASGSTAVWLLASGYLLVSLAMGTRPARGRSDELVGEVMQLNLRSRQLQLKVPNQPQLVMVTVHPDTTVVLSAGNRHPGEGTALSLREIAVGDRLSVSGSLSPDRSRFDARQVLLIPRKRA